MKRPGSSVYEARHMTTTERLEGFTSCFTAYDDASDEGYGLGRPPRQGPPMRTAPPT